MQVRFYIDFADRLYETGDDHGTHVVGTAIGQSVDDSDNRNMGMVCVRVCVLFCC